MRQGQGGPAPTSAGRARAARAQHPRGRWPRPTSTIDPFNNVPENLAALCQRCHILHDKAEHLRRRRLTYLARRALGDLFTGPYREA